MGFDSEMSASHDDPHSRFPALQNLAWRPVVRSATDVFSYADTVWEHFDVAFENAPFTLNMQVAGRQIQIATDLADLVEIFKYGIAHEEGHGIDAEAKFIAAGSGLFSKLPPAPVWEDHRYNDRRMCRKLESSNLRMHHYRERDFWQLFERERSIGVQLMATPFCVPDWDTGSPLRNLLNWHLSSGTSGLVHAGTLGLNGRGIMLAGPGGSGKSGTVLAGLAAGFQSVGDDYILVDMDEKSPDDVVVKPVFNTLKSDEKGLKRLGLRWTGEPNWQGKFQFGFKELTGNSPEKSLSVFALCVPQVTGGNKTWFEKMPTREAFLALTKTGIQQIPGEGANSFHICNQVVRRLPTYKLFLGTDPDEICPAIRSFIEAET